MERRKSYRKAIHHEATVCLQGGAKWPCIIEDYCDMGMYLTYDITASRAIESSLSLGVVQSFTVRFLGPQGETFDVPVEVARRIDGASGVRFVARNEEAVEALVKLSLGTKNAQVLITDAKPVMDACVKIVYAFAGEHLPDVYPGIENVLKEEAVAASSDQQANLYMELAQQLKRKKDQITQKFLQCFDDPMQFLSGEYTHQAEVSEHLSLIDKGEFEDWLTSRVLITKAESQYREQLLPLKIRLDALALGGEQFKFSVLGPELFVLAYRTAIHALVANNYVERLLFKEFEQSFMMVLAPLYEQLNALLVREGVLEDLDVAKQLKRHSASSDHADGETPENEEAEEAADDRMEAPRSAQPETLPDYLPPLNPARKPYGGSADTSHDLPSADHQSLKHVLPPFQRSEREGDLGSFQQNQAQAQAAFDKVMGLMRSLKSMSVGDGSAIPHAADAEIKYTEDELREGLALMQAASTTPEAQEDPRSLLDRVMGNLSEGSDDQKGIEEDQQVAIDVVDRFFVSLNRNPRLTQDAIQQLNMLEIPVLKVLLQDENFFNEGNHAVRQVMNRIAQLGAKGARLSPSIRSQIESLVKQILDNFEENTDVFDEVLGKLDDMVDRQSKLYSKNVERVAAAAEGVYRVDQAKSAVVKALNDRLGGKPIPKAVQTLIDHGWKDLLNLVHIKHGESSKEWDEHLEIVDLLLKYSENPDQKLDMKRVLPKIQEGLKTISGNEKPPEVVREELKKLIEAAPHRKHEMVSSQVEQIEETEESREARNAKVLAELKPWIRRARSIQVGAWVQLLRNNDEPQFMRLVWVAKGYSKFVFVNHQGMKVVELGLFKFARYLRDEMIKPDPSYEVPIVNQGLDDMIKDVYDKLAYESSHDKDSDLLNYQEACRQIRNLMSLGQRDAPCGLLYIRVMETGRPSPAPVDTEVAREIGGQLHDIRTGASVVGRLNAFDFVVFTTEDDMDLLNVRVSEQMAIYQRQDSDDKRFEYEVGEARASLGFINPESLFAQASHALTPIEASLTEEPSKGPALPTTEQPLEEVDAGVMKHLEEVSAAPRESDVSTSDFEIFFQRAMGISEKAANEANCELLCSKSGSGVSYVPEHQKDAQALDHWWLQTIQQRYSQASPDWEGLGDIRVKLSGHALNSDALVEQWITLAETESINPREIWFDLYDSAVIVNTAAAADRIDELAACGFRFCLDQFGTTRAPFYLMKSLPVDMIKIDEDYIEALNQEEADQGPTDSIVEVAHYLDKNVLATSVDSAICLQRMRKMGIDYVQGSTIGDYEKLGEA